MYSNEQSREAIRQLVAKMLGTRADGQERYLAGCQVWNGNAEMLNLPAYSLESGQVYDPGTSKHGAMKFMWGFSAWGGDDYHWGP